MDLDEKFKYLAEYFDQSNSREVSEENTNATSEDGQLEFFWKECMPEAIDSSRIIARTQQKINYESTKKRRYRLFLKLGSAAASVLLIVSLSLYLFKSDENNKLNNLKAIASNMDNIATDKVILITSKSRLAVDENSKIQYSANGNIAVNSNVIKNENGSDAKSNDAEEYNQLIVPVGKRSRIQLSDGTLMWVNSNTKVVYPRVFKGHTRSIYVQGEAYLEVAHDKSRPFIVTANDFDLKVLGTKFNITNYNSSKETNIVLVEGSVEVKDKNNKVSKLSPNDLLAIKEGSTTQQKKVDTSDYTSWINGILNLKGDKLSVIANKLSLYFGVTIKCSPAVENEKVYGKLDLKDNLTDILECIKYALPIKIEENNNEILLSKGN